MPCDHIDLGGGSFAIVCRGRQRTKPCSVCQRRPGVKLCDYKLRGPKAGKTCDRPICEKCAVHEEPDTDYCPTHGRIVEQEKAAQESLFK